YIAQPPLYKVKRGKKEQYIKDEAGMFAYLMSQATRSLKVTSNGNIISGKELTRALERTVDYKRFSGRMTRRLGNDEELRDVILESLAGKQGVLTKEGVRLRKVFAEEELIGQVEAAIMDAGYETSLIPDEEHGLSEIDISLKTGGSVLLDWDLGSYVEFQKSLKLKAELEETFPSPFTLTKKDETIEIGSRVELLDEVISAAKKEIGIQRYKGLGEMNPEQLWETTMDPEGRTLLQVRIEDAIETDNIFTILMGDQVEPRRQFIETNALDVKNLDV
ncbi:MAG: DNA gyrase subunit B, partial [Pyrinomonadaceae bacterium]|nr:DNA gyrase subunit B [Pyrinomonadaceae bacterium]